MNDAETVQSGLSPHGGVIPQLDYAEHQNKRLSPSWGVILLELSKTENNPSLSSAQGSYSDELGAVMSQILVCPSHGELFSIKYI